VREGLERKARIAALGDLNPRDVFPKVHVPEWRGNPRDAGRYDAALGGRGGIHGAGNQAEPQRRGQAATRAKAVREAAPGRAAGLQRSMAQGYLLRRAYLGGVEQRFRTRQRVREEPMGVQASV